MKNNYTKAQLENSNSQIVKIEGFSSLATCKVFGVLLILYALLAPFFQLPIVITILPLTSIGLYMEVKSPWKKYAYPLTERIGDIVSLFVVWVLSNLQQLISIQYSNSIPYLFQPLLGLLIVDGIAYGIHRLSHLNLWLWKFHRVHHSRTYPSVLNTCYENITDASLRLIGPGIVLVLLGFNNNTIIITSLTSTLFGIISHMNGKVSFPKWLQYLFITPLSHQIHHDMNQIDKNCGSITHIWDHVFGTFELYQMDPKDYGLKEEECISNHPINIFYTNDNT